MLGLVNDPNHRKTDLNSIQASQELMEKVILWVCHVPRHGTDSFG